MKRIAVLLYSLINYLFGVAALLYLIAFLCNLCVPKSIDSGVPGDKLPAIFIDLGLMVLFGLQHSIMARHGFKSWLACFVEPAIERSTFLLATTLVTFALCLLWQPLPVVIWQANNATVSHGMLAIGLAGWVLLLVATFLVDHFHLFGLRQAWLYLVGRDASPLPFKTVWLYRYIRHPIMTGAFIGIWFTPVLTVGHLLIALGLSAYIFVGVYYEERDLIMAFGQKYQEYMRVTGKFLPIWTLRSRQSDVAARRGTYF